MVKKKINICFANPKINMSDHLNDLIEAVTWASHNLAMRHRIKIEGPILKNDKWITIFVESEEEVQNIGRHLRGISIYLLKNKKCYSNYLIGKRLLYYFDD